MSMTHLLILGAGFSGKAIGDVFRQAGFSVSGTTRSTEKAESLRKIGIEPILYEGGAIVREIDLQTATLRERARHELDPGARLAPAEADRRQLLRSLFERAGPAEPT